LICIINNLILIDGIYPKFNCSFIFRGKLVSTKLFVGSLPWAVNDDTLKSAFEAHGAVVTAKVVTDRQTGRSRGFGFVEMENESEANNAIQALNGSQLNGRSIIVSEAKPKT
jgi:RNA recognition motif-containing protein